MREIESNFVGALWYSYSISAMTSPWENFSMREDKDPEIGFGFSGALMVDHFLG